MTTDRTLVEARAVKPLGLWVLLAGVLIPAVTFVVELTLHLCADLFSDPMPTLVHVLAVGGVPCSIAWVARELHRGRMPTTLATGALGFSTGVASYYGLIFLPLSPIAVVMVLYLGIGLLALAPLLSLLACVSSLRRLRMGGVGMRPARLGGVVACVLLLGLEAPSAAQDVWTEWALSADSQERTRGLSWLRKWGDDEELLRQCYHHDSSRPGLLRLMLPMLSPSRTPDAQQARDLYFRVTGTSFASQPRPRQRTFNTLFDEDQGGDKVGTKTEHVTLVSSSVDGSIATEPNLGYVEWTLAFHNTSTVQQEARALVALPSGGVVSRATLWVNGEPKEATFAAAGQARAAYQQVVRQRRDPLLITQSSPERVLVQCFPVPPEGDIKIRLGVTFAPTLEDGRHARFGLPYLVERNFDIPASTRHALWIDADALLQTADTALARTPSKFGVRGTVTTEAMRTLLFRSPAKPGTYFSDGPPPTLHVVQTSERQPKPVTKHRIVVLDTSHGLAPHKDKLTQQILRLAAHAPLDVVLTTDASPRVLHVASASDVSVLQRQLADTEFAGGHDSAEALGTAAEIASRTATERVIWLAGPQPEDGNVDVLWQWLTRSSSPFVVVPFAFGEGEPALLHRLPASAIARPVRFGDALADFEGFVTTELDTDPTWHAVRQASSLPPPSGAQKTGAHLTRLWAAEEVARGCRDPLVCQRLAIGQHLVTAVTGAVVLETAAQYEAAGLEPADASSDVPTVPEPATWLLMAMMVAALIHESRRRQWVRS